MALPQDFDELARKVRNWGRWGDDDELGTLNLITDEVVRRAAACVRTGKRFSLALPLELDGPQTGAVPGRSNPIRTMTHVNSAVTGDPEAFCMSDDVVFMGLQAATHWDSMAHVSYRGTLYNGFPADSITAAGAARCAIHKVRTLTSRGVLLDVARARGVGRLEGGYAIGPDDLDAAEAQAGVRVEPGDIILVRTGQVQLLKAGSARKYGFPTPGLGMGAALWLRERDAAAVATDTLALEVFPGEREDLFLPVHLLHLVEMGLCQGQNFDLEALAADCEADGVWEFLLEATPEPFVGAVGAPVNPVAIK